MRRTTLATIGFDGFAAAFNRVYEGYAVPFAVDAAWAERHARDNDLDLAVSPVWLDEDGLAMGLAALGVRGERGWIGGFGLVAARRGQGLGRDLLAEVLQAARKRGLRRVQLEVLAEKAPAIALYERGGFRRRRVLRILEGERPAERIGNPAVREAVTEVVLRQFERLHPAPMAWQREAPSFARLEGVRARVVATVDAPVASLLVQAMSGGPARVLDIGVAVDEADAAAAVGSLLGGVDTAPDRPLRLLNEPAGSVVDAALCRLGWRETGRQFEMVVEVRGRRASG